MRKIPVILAFTPNYLVPAAVTIHSVVSHSSGEFEFICLTQGEISERQKDIISRMGGGHSAFRFIPMEDLPDGVVIDRRFSAAAVYRLLLPEILPEYSRVIYLDCDVIVRNDMAELFENTVLDGKLLGAVYEAPVGNQAIEREALGCDPARYFNSGVLLMNLEQMREEEVSSRLMECLGDGNLQFPDQDVLNIVCQGRVVPLPPYWNSIRTFFLPQYRADFLKVYSVSDLEQVLQHGNVHFTGGKPWDIFSEGFGIWWSEYFLASDELRCEWKPSRKILLLAFCYRYRHVGRMLDGVRDVYRHLKYR